MGGWLWVACECFRVRLCAGMCVVVDGCGHCHQLACTMLQRKYSVMFKIFSQPPVTLYCFLLGLGLTQWVQESADDLKSYAKKKRVTEAVLGGSSVVARMVAPSVAVASIVHR